MVPFESPINPLEAAYLLVTAPDLEAEARLAYSIGLPLGMGLAAVNGQGAIAREGSPGFCSG